MSRDTTRVEAFRRGYKLFDSLLVSREHLFEDASENKNGDTYPTTSVKRFVKGSIDSDGYFALLRYANLPEHGFFNKKINTEKTVIT